MALVAGVDSSTQSCKVVIRDAETGALVRSGRASHPDGTEVDPQAWWAALQLAIAAAGGLADVSAISVGGQQHGMVCLDSDGVVVRDALLWNDTRSAAAARDLIQELGGPQPWASAVGSVPVASFTVTKLRWLAAHEPASAAHMAAVCLPHDWLTWRMTQPGAFVNGFATELPATVGGDIRTLTTDRGDASGTGYWSPTDEAYRPDLLRLALGFEPLVPRVLGPAETAGRIEGAGGALLGPGSGDNAASALGVGASAGDVIISIGTSGVVCAVSSTPTADVSGTVAGFASATGDFLPLIATLNAARLLDAAGLVVGADHEHLSQLALSAPSGSDGLVLVPYLEGERTPNRPDATGALHGMTQHNMTPAHFARAAVEGLLCGLADGLDALVAQGVQVQRAILIGGGAHSQAVRELAPAILGRPVVVPEPGEYVADGAARQAAWVLAGTPVPPTWQLGHIDTYDAPVTPAVRARYAEVREMTATRLP